MSAVQKAIKQAPQIAEARAFAHNSGSLRGVKVSWVPMEPVLNSAPIITVIKTTTMSRPICAVGSREETTSCSKLIWGRRNPSTVMFVGSAVQSLLEKLDPQVTSRFIWASLDCRRASSQSSAV